MVRKRGNVLMMRRVVLSHNHLVILILPMVGIGSLRFIHVFPDKEQRLVFKSYLVLWDLRGLTAYRGSSTEMAIAIDVKP